MGIGHGLQVASRQVLAMSAPTPPPRTSDRDDRRIGLWPAPPNGQPSRASGPGEHGPPSLSSTASPSTASSRTGSSSRRLSNPLVRAAADGLTAAWASSAITNSGAERPAADGKQQYGQQPDGQQPPPGQPFGQQRPGGAGGGANALIPPGFGGVPLPPDIPQAVQRAFLVWLVIIGVNVLGTIISFGRARRLTSPGSGSSSRSSRAARSGCSSPCTSAVGRSGRASCSPSSPGSGCCRACCCPRRLSSCSWGSRRSYGLVSLVTSVVFLAGGTLALINAWHASSNAWFGKAPVLSAAGAGGLR